MDVTLDAVDDLLRWSESINDAVEADTLREWRFDLIKSSVYLDYAMGVLAMDLAILDRGLEKPNEDLLQHLVDELPALLHQLTIDESIESESENLATGVAVAELAITQATGLLQLHVMVLESDLHDLAVIRGLIEECVRERENLDERRHEVRARLQRIQDVMRHHYSTGSASVDDWFR